MVSPRCLSLVSVLALTAPFHAPALETTPLYWPDKNGPTMDGVVPEGEAARLPRTWDSESGHNVVWRTPLEAIGHSSPVIGGDLIWFTAASVDGHQQWVYAIHRVTGEVIHHKLLFENPAPEPLGNPLNNYAAPSCVLEDGAVYVHCGTYGTAKLDATSADVIWQRRDINVRHFRGPGSSPLLWENLLVLTFDGINRQFVTALSQTLGHFRGEGECFAKRL